MAFALPGQPGPVMAVSPCSVRGLGGCSPSSPFFPSPDAAAKPGARVLMSGVVAPPPGLFQRAVTEGVGQRVLVSYAGYPGLMQSSVLKSGGVAQPAVRQRVASSCTPRASVARTQQPGTPLGGSAVAAAAVTVASVELGKSGAEDLKNNGVRLPSHSLNLAFHDCSTPSSVSYSAGTTPMAQDFVTPMHGSAMVSSRTSRSGSVLASPTAAAAAGSPIQIENWQAVGQRLAYVLQDISPASSSSPTPAAIRLQQAQVFFPQTTASSSPGALAASPMASGKPLQGGALAAYLLQSYA